MDGADVSSGEKEGVFCSELVLPEVWVTVSEIRGALLDDWVGRTVPTAVEVAETLLGTVVAEEVAVVEEVEVVVMAGVGWANAERLLLNSFSSFDSRVFSSLVMRSSSLVMVSSSLV